MHHDSQKIIFCDNFYLLFPICDRKDFEKCSLLRKLQISHSPLAPSSQVLLDRSKALQVKIASKCVQKNRPNNPPKRDKKLPKKS